ncbi:unnamed protein product [Chrysoparadoxa australica]
MSPTKALGGLVALLQLAGHISAASSSGTIVLPTYEHNFRTRRLDDGQRDFQTVPLLPGYGTHFTYIYVGSPPQRVSVIMDTGSHFTAFPCTDCKACGEHTDNYWDLAASSTAHKLGCSECPDHRTFTCSSGDKCTFGQSYSEGSSWTAFQVEDQLVVGAESWDTTPELNKSNVMNFMFGCISSQTGLFNTQLADGIMGLSASDFTLPWHMHDLGLIDERVFSMCMAKGGGTMVLGGGESMLRTSEMIFTPLTSMSSWFSIKMLDISIGGTSIGTDSAVYQRGKGTIVDSGTTDTYLPVEASKKWSARWLAATGQEYTNNKIILTKEQLAALPVITLSFDGGLEVVVKPEAYMEENSGAPGQYGARIYLTERAGAVLGANVMRDHEVVFDHAHGRVGFAPADCDYANLMAKKRAKASPEDGGAVGAGSSSEEGQPCLMSELQLLVACDAVCPEGNLDDVFVSEGVEVWSQQAIMEGVGSGNECPPPITEERLCSRSCPTNSGAHEQAGIDTPSSSEGSSSSDDAEEDDGEPECMAMVWSYCDDSCQQLYMDECDGGQEKWRDCATGPVCSKAMLGLLIEGVAEVEFVQQESRPLPLWSPALNSEFSDQLAEVAGVDGGAVMVRDVIVEGPVYRLPFELHISPEIDEESAVSAVNQLKDHSSMARLLGEFSHVVRDMKEIKVSDLAVSAAADGQPYSLISEANKVVDIQGGLTHTDGTNGTALSEKYGMMPIVLAIGLMSGLGTMFCLHRCRKRAAALEYQMVPVQGANREDEALERGLPDSENEVRLARETAAQLDQAPLCAAVNRKRSPTRGAA